MCFEISLIFVVFFSIIFTGVSVYEKQFQMKMAPNHGFVMTDASGEPVSRTYQYRKVMKPMLERKRRARINRCLDELKELMTGALQTVS